MVKSQNRGNGVSIAARRFASGEKFQKKEKKKKKRFAGERQGRLKGADSRGEK